MNFSSMKMLLQVISFILVIKCVACDINNSDGKNEFRRDYTYYPNVGYWFKANPVPVDWHTARLLCHYEGAELASPLNDDIMTIIKQIVTTHEPKLKLYFLGVHQTFGLGVYTSIEGIPLEKLAIKNWFEGEPNGFQNQQCLVYSNDGTVWDYNCPELYPFICYRKYSDADKLTECGTVDKAYRLDRHTGHCHKYHKHADTWDRALKICHSEGGYLAIINSQEEAHTITELLKSSPKPLYAFDSTVALGYREWGQNDSWWTIHGQTLEEAGYESWGEYSSNKPADQPAQSCGGFKDGSLDSIHCDKSYAFVCEKTVDSLTNSSSITFRDK